MKVRMFDHVAHYHRDKEAIDSAIREVLESGQLVMGPAVRAFEEEFAAYCGANHAVAVTSGSSALHLALRALDVGVGDEVITVANSDIPTSQAISHTGARVVWIDIDPNSYNMDPALIEAAVTPRTKAILPVHLYGVPADMAPIKKTAEKYGLHVVDDAALAAGARCRGKRIGTLGIMTAFSTAPGKILDGIGSGGVITTASTALYDRLNTLRHYGRARPPYRDRAVDGATWPSETVEIGFNERLDTIHAAVLRIRLRHLDEALAQRRKLAEIYRTCFRETDVRVQVPPADSESSWRVFTVRVPHRDRLFEALYKAGYEVTLPYLPPDHLDVCYQDYGYPPGSLPQTEAFCQELLALPCHPYMTVADAEQIASALLNLL